MLRLRRNTGSRARGYWNGELKVENEEWRMEDQVEELKLRGSDGVEPAGGIGDGYSDRLLRV